MFYEIDDFMEEIKLEMAGYEISEDLINQWEDQAKKWIELNRQKKNNRIIQGHNSIKIKIEDESEIFKIVDRFYAAIENEEIEAYFNNFSVF